MKFTEKYVNIWAALWQNLGFLILYIAYNSGANVQAKMMEQLGFGKLGFYNLACVQLTIVVGTMFSTTIISKLGIRVAHAGGAIGITIWTLSSLVPAMKKNEPDPYKREHDWIYSDVFVYSVMLAASCICGFFCGILWTVQGIYS
jgi:hypothetical protein